MLFFNCTKIMLSRKTNKANLNIIKSCCVEGCDSKNRISKFNEKLYCNKHYKHMIRHGEIKHRTKYDKNEIIIHDDYAEIVLYDINQNEKNRAIIDVEDVECIKHYKWFLRDDGYVLSHINKGRGPIRLHRFLLNIDDPKQIIDHINQNPLDNRKLNLRIATHSQNHMNVDNYAHNTSGVKGVWFRKDTNKWCAEIIRNKKKISLGCYNNKNDAIVARKKAEYEMFGEYMSGYDEYIKNINVSIV